MDTELKLAAARANRLGQDPSVAKLILDATTSGITGAAAHDVAKLIAAMDERIEALEAVEREFERLTSEGSE